MGAILSFFEFLQQHAELSREAFLAQVRCPYLYFENLAALVETSEFSRLRDDTPPALMKQRSDLHGLGVSGLAPVRNAANVSGRITLGRSPSADIAIPDARISKRHASFDRLQGYWTITDTGSTNGTAVDGVPLPGERCTNLASGARIELAGSLSLVFLEPPELHALICDVAESLAGGR